MHVGKRDVRIFLQSLIIGLLAGAIITYALVYKAAAKRGTTSERSKLVGEEMVSEKVCLNQMINVAATCKP